MHPHSVYLPELREMLETNNTEEMRDFCEALNPVRVAEFVEGLEPLQIWQILLSVKPALRADIFQYLENDTQADIMETAPREEIAEFISYLPSDDRVDVLQSVEDDIVDELLPLMATEDRHDIQRLRAFPEDSCGSVMSTDFVRLSEKMTVSEAIGEITRQSEVIETIYYLYVVDENDHLVGLVSAKQLLKKLSHPQTLIGDLMERDLVTVKSHESREQAATEVARFDFLAIPVVDDEHHMLGIITHDDVIDVMQDAATEDAYRMAAISPMDEDYLEASFFTVWKNRVFWLACLFLASLFTFSALEYFEDAMKQIIVLALFLPLILSTGGNSGSQAATLITRAMALGHVRPSDIFRVFRHELLMGLAMGTALGAMGFFRAYFTTSTSLEDTNRIMFAIAISFTVTLICLWGTLVGSMLPFAFKKIGVDPGVASSPFVATVVDVSGIIIYFTIAKMLLM